VRHGLHSLSLRKAGFSPRVVAAHDPASPLEAVLSPSVAVRGLVVGHDGAGLPDVAVHLAQPAGANATARTADDGSFSFTDLVPGPFELFVAKPGTGVKALRRGEAPADLHIEIAALGTLELRVTDQKTGAPVTRFSVATNRGDPEDWEGTGEAQEVSDAAGVFRLTELPLGEVTVEVEAEGYLGKEATGVVSAPGDESPPVEVALEPGVTVSGRVTAATGGPLADVSVFVAARDEGASTESDESGHYRLAGVRPGTVTLQFRRSGYAPLKKSIDTAETTRADAVLARGLSVKGVVTSAGAGVAEVRVSASSSAADASHAYAVSGEGGTFTLDGLTPGRYRVSARHEDGGEALLENVDPEAAAPLTLALERKPTATVSGTITGLPALDGEMMVAVSVSGEDGPAGHAPADGRGAFRVEGAPVGRVRVQAFAVWRGGQTRASRVNELDLAAGQEAQTVLGFDEGVVIAGRVTRDASPLAGAVVSFRTRDESGSLATARTSGAGEYEVVGLEPGPHEVSVNEGSFSYSTQYVVVESSRFDIDATGAAVRGQTLSSADGSPVPGVEVSFWRDAESQPATSVTANAQGVFSVRSLREGRYRVLTSKEGFGQEVEEVVLEAGSGAELVLALSPAEGLSLSVVDARDHRPLDATVVVRDLSRRVIANRHQGVEADGTLRIPLAPGRYLLSTSADGFGTVTLPVTAPGQGLRVGLTPGGTLVLDAERDLRGRVRLRRPDGEEYVRCWCNGIADIQLTGRRTRVTHVTAGTYSIELVDHAGTARGGPTVTVEEGQTATVRVE
jgi:hypothetical protein